jgi:hypothetical protein
MTAVPVTRTFVAGEIVLASHFNLNLRDPINFLLSPPLCQARQSTLQTLTTSTFASITMTSEDVDSSGMHSTVTNTSRCTAVYPGWYRWAGAACFAANATGNRATKWLVNGAILNIGQAVTDAIATNVQTTPAVTLLAYLNVGDYIELQAWQSSGGNLNTSVTAGEQSYVSGDWRSN